MNWADWTILAILGLSIAISMVRGFIREAMSLAVWVAAFAIAMMFHEPLAVWYEGLIETTSLRYLAAWLSLFVAVLLVGGLVNYLLGQLVRTTGLGGTDRMLGAVFGGIRGLVVVMALLMVLPSVLPVDGDQWWHESLLIPHFLRFEGWAREVATALAEFFKSLW